MDYQDILARAKQELVALDSHLIDVVDIKRPPNLEYAKQLAKVISKLSPLLGNMIEFSTVDLLNEHDWDEYGKWIRQDPGFPDALFQSDLIIPNPGSYTHLDVYKRQPPMCLQKTMRRSWRGHSSRNC